MQRSEQVDQRGEHTDPTGEQAGPSLVARGMTPADWPAVERIYADGIAGGNATFETRVPSWEAFDAGRVPALRLVAVDVTTAEVLGWAAATPVSHRPVYAGVLEHSVYVSGASQGRGVGRLLLGRFVALSEAFGIWSLRSGVFPENLPSLRLHAHLGFADVGRLERVGRAGTGPGAGWRDVVLLERRSAVVGGETPLVRAVVPHSGREDDDRAAVRRLLTRAGLPLDGLDDSFLLWVADAEATGGQVVGAVALERHEGVFLLRSVVVDPRHRGRGLGEHLVRTALGAADLLSGAPARVALLTETAVGWFERFGFAAVERVDLPVAVHASPELAGACPDTARAYLR